MFNGCSVYAMSSGENAARGTLLLLDIDFDEAAFMRMVLSRLFFSGCHHLMVDKLKRVHGFNTTVKMKDIGSFGRRYWGYENNYNAKLINGIVRFAL